MSLTYTFSNLSNAIYSKKQPINNSAISFDNLNLSINFLINRSPLKYQSQTVSSGSLITIIDRNQSEFPTVYGYIL